MKVKLTVSIAVFAVCFLSASSISLAVDTGQIDKVRVKGVLDDADLQVIDSFIAQSIQEIIKAADFTTVSRVRATVVSRVNSNSESSAAQYSQQFFDSVRKYLSAGLEEAANLTPENLSFRAELNLLILLDELGNMRLAELAMKQFSSKNEAVRYWAVHCVTNPTVIKHLKQPNPEGSKLAVKIAEQLKGIVDTTGPETVALAAEFGAKVEIPQAEKLLLQIADMRIKKYADWTVKNEILDVTILGLLSDKMSPERNNQETGRRFGQLFSYAMQRYIQNIKGGNFLTAEQKDHLASVLAETEKFISKFSGIQQSVIKKAIESDDYTTLWQEHSRLLGDETRPGELPGKLKFDYGDKRIWPLLLPERPETKASE